MSNRNKNFIHEPFVLLFITTIVFVVLSFFPTAFSINGFSAKPVNFLRDVLVDTSSPTNSNDSHVIKNLSNAPNTNEKHSIEFANDSSGGLLHFFHALDLLKQGKKKTVRIAYFGDSNIENDFITQDLRKLLQEKFGGQGVGFLPITSISAEYRKTITQTFSDNWKVCELDELQTHPTGISGYTFVPAWNNSIEHKNNSEKTGDSWVKLFPVEKKGLNSFQDVRMFYGKTIGEVRLEVNNQSISFFGKSKVNELKINNGIPMKSLSVSFKCKEAIDIYGFSIDSEEGIFLDNFSLRGKNGMTLAMIPDSVLQGLNKYLGYDLVIFQFGINVLDTKMENYKWYENGMLAVIEHFRKDFPGTSMLIISASDRGINQGGRWTTNPEIPKLVSAQEHFSEVSACGFWNLYNAMGGFESMASKWAGADTALANKDFTHFNLKGSEKVGTMLYHDLMAEYQLYKNNSGRK